MNIYINGVKASYLDLTTLFHNLRNKKDGLKSVIRLRNELHFETV